LEKEIVKFLTTLDAATILLLVIIIIYLTDKVGGLILKLNEKWKPQSRPCTYLIHLQQQVKKRLVQC